MRSAAFALLVLAAGAAEAQVLELPHALHTTTERPAVLPTLYMSSALLQGYDAYSTLTVLKNGGREANPAMRTITQYPAAFIGVKAAVTVTSVMAAERLWKNHHRVGAILTMAVSNGLMAYVAAKNSAVMREQGRR